MEKIWLKNYPAGVPETIDADFFASLVDLFEQYANEYAELPVFSNMGTHLLYQQLAKLSEDFAAFLQQELGLVKGERLAIMMPNILQYPVCIFGGLKAGLTIVNINPLYTERELKFQLIDSGASAVVILENFATTLANVLKETPIKKVIVTRIGDMLGNLKGTVFNFAVKYIKRMVPEWNIPGYISFKKALKKGAHLQLKKVLLSGEDYAFLQYTGGTTGVAKGTILTHRNMVANVLQTVSWVRSDVTVGKEIVVAALPFYHIFALTVCCFCFMVLGAECLLITNPRDMKLFLKILKKKPPTVFIGLNTLFNGMMNHPDFDKSVLSKLKLTVSGGMSMQKAVADRWQQATGTPVLEGYGLTETSPVVTINPLNLKKFNGSIGLPVPGTDVSIRDDQGKELSIGEIGELCVHGPQVMKGYWNHPEETALVLSADGWLRSGDIARVDDQGFFYIVDRKKDMIIVSGFNVYPNEVEEVIASMEGVKEVAVIGIPSEKTGEEVKAYIVKKNPELTAEQVIAYCHKYLTHYKVPKNIEFRDSLPKSNVGKVLRRKLREEVEKK